MNSKTISMDKRTSLVVGIILIILSLGLFFYFFIIPYINYNDAVNSWIKTKSTIIDYKKAIHGSTKHTRDTKLVTMNILRPSIRLVENPHLYIYVLKSMQLVKL